MSRCGSSNTTAANGSLTVLRSSRPISPLRSPTGWNRSPCTALYPWFSHTCRCDCGCPANAYRPVRSACTRNAACCAIVPDGKNKAFCLPSRPATRSSSSRTGPSAVMSGVTHPARRRSTSCGDRRGPEWFDSERRISMPTRLIITSILQ